MNINVTKWNIIQKLIGGRQTEKGVGTGLLWQGVEKFGLSYQWCPVKFEVQNIVGVQDFLIQVVFFPVNGLNRLS